MKEKTASIIDRHVPKFLKFSSIKDMGLNSINNKNISDKENNNYYNRNSSFYRGLSPSPSRKISPYGKKITNNNLGGFIPRFGMGTKIKNQSNTNNIIIKVNNNNLEDSEEIEPEQNLKFVEKELKNRLKDMTVIMNNKSLIMENKWKDDLNISSISEYKKKKKKTKKKKIKKKIENEKGEDQERKMIRKKPLYDSLDEEELPADDDSDYVYIFLCLVIINIYYALDNFI